jgi:heme exporter protein C
MAARAGAVLAAIGLINIPIIHYSVQWWSTLHQGPTITRFDAPAIHISMLIPLLIMALGFKLYYAANVLVRMRCELLDAERSSAWVKQLGK